MTTRRHYAADGYHPDHGLTGGRWESVNGVQRWQPNEPFALHAVPDLLEDDEAIGCSICGATLTQTCITDEGRRTKDHPGREIPRQCGCGEPLEWMKRLCATCRLAARRATTS